MNPISEWINQLAQNLSLAEINSMIGELNENAEAKALCQTPVFYYELAKVQSLAAFVLWQSNSPSESKLFPVLKSAGPHQLMDNPMAFREIAWAQQQDADLKNSSYKESDLLSKAAIIAGLKYKSYQLAFDYAQSRIQGGKTINSWSSIQTLLSELYLEVSADAQLIENLNAASALHIISGADHFVSQNMQVMGGAGYMEDYIIERLYRECIFLKNWPMAYKAELMNHYQNQVLAL